MWEYNKITLPDVSESTCCTQCSTRVVESIGSAPVSRIFFFDRTGHGGWNSVESQVLIQDCYPVFLILYFNNCCTLMELSTHENNCFVQWLRTCLCIALTQWFRYLQRFLFGCFNSDSKRLNHWTFVCVWMYVLFMKYRCKIKNAGNLHAYFMNIDKIYNSTTK